MKLLRVVCVLGLACVLIGGCKQQDQTVQSEAKVERSVETISQPLTPPPPQMASSPSPISTSLPSNSDVLSSKQKPLPMTVEELKTQIFARDVEKIEALLKGGVNVNGNDKLETTPLVFAAMLGDRNEIMGLLVKYGADVNLMSAKGFTPLVSAAQLNRTDSVQFLVENGADVNLKDARGTPPLLGAASMGYTGVVKILLTKQPDLTVKNPTGHIALQLAEGYGHTETAQILRDAGAK